MKFLYQENSKVSPGLRLDYSFVGNQPPLDAAVDTTHDYVY
jgi:hypothetical protein